MSERLLHEVLICTDPDCGFRFPLSPTEKRPVKCPRCGSVLQTAELPYKAFSVPLKAKPKRGYGFVSVLDNIRSAYNVGSIFRTADGAGIDRLYLCGITPTPEQPKVCKTALNAEKSVPWEHSWSVLETVKNLKNNGYFIVSLEGGPDSGDIFESLPIMQQNAQPVALIVGNEISGIDPEVIRISSMNVYIPMEGIKESLNVATAFGIAAYLIRYQGLKL